MAQKIKKGYKSSDPPFSGRRGSFEAYTELSLDPQFPKFPIIHPAPVPRGTSNTQENEQFESEVGVG